jgi:hypothetical protein
MSLSRSITRNIDRQFSAIQLLVDRKAPVSDKSMTTTLAGNTSSGIRRRAHRIVAAERAAFKPVTVIKLVDHDVVEVRNDEGDLMSRIVARTQEIHEPTKYDARAAFAKTTRQMARFLGGRS